MNEHANDLPLTPPAADRIPWWLAVSVMVIAGLIVFGSAISAPFVEWDDGILVGNNPMLWPESGVSIWQAWREPYAGLYTPLTFMLHAAVAAVSRASGRPMNPAYFHAASVGLHLAGGVVLWRWLRRLCGRNEAALFGALLWMLHPLQAEPVAWVSGTNGLLAGVLAIAALAAATSGAQANGWRRMAALSVATALFAASLAAKPADLMLPAVVIAVHRLLLNRPWKETLTLAFVWALIAAPFIYVGTDTQTNGVLEGDLPVVQRLMIIAHSLGFYVSKTIWPVGLATDYGLPPHIVLAQRLWVRPALLAVTICIAAMACFRRIMPVTVGILVFTLGLLPVLGVVPFYYQSFSIVADRYAYFALVGMAIVVTYAFRAISPRAARGIAILLTVVFGIATGRQVTFWRDTASVFERAAAVNPLGLAANNYGANAARDAGDLPREQLALGRILDIRPFDDQLRVRYADVLLRSRQADDAAAQLRLVLTRNSRDPALLEKLGAALKAGGHAEAARQAFGAALSIDPKLPAALAGMSELDATSPATQPSGQ